MELKTRIRPLGTGTSVASISAPSSATPGTTVNVTVTLSAAGAALAEAKIIGGWQWGTSTGLLSMSPVSTLITGPGTYTFTSSFIMPSVPVTLTAIPQTRDTGATDWDTGVSGAATIAVASTPTPAQSSIDITSMMNLMVTMMIVMMMMKMMTGMMKDV